MSFTRVYDFNCQRRTLNCWQLNKRDRDFQNAECKTIFISIIVVITTIDKSHTGMLGTFRVYYMAG